MVRGLDERELRIAHQQAHRHLQERPGRNVVAIEDGDELAVRALERVVQVPGLGVAVVGTDDVSDPRLGGEGAELRAAAVIQQVDAKLVGRPIESARGEHRDADHLERLVVGRDEDVHRRPAGDIAGQRDRFSRKRRDGLHVREHQHRARVKLRREEDGAQDRIERPLVGEGGGEPPPEISRGGRDRDGDERQARKLPLAPADEDREHEGADRHRELRVQIERRRRVDPEAEERDEDPHSAPPPPQLARQGEEVGLHS